VEANIVIRHKEKALAIPKTYLVGQDSIWIDKDGDIKLIKIQKGVENMEYVEVVAGLDTNSRLVNGQ
jgi:HlyD family secretion protein